MRNLLKILLVAVVFIAVSGCSDQAHKTFQAKVVYKSEALIVKQISENAFEHTSFLQTEDFGNVPCNGLVVRNNGETVVFDTPSNDKSSEELIKWINGQLRSKINAIIPTHFHDDCLGGLTAFHKNNIPSYAYFKTTALARENGFAAPKHNFTDSLILKLGSTHIVAKYFGEGHTKDNIVGYFPAERILFGGCLIKEMAATKGYLGDANVGEWSNTVRKVKKEYSDVRIVVPGHGIYGDARLLDYTIDLFSKLQ